MAHKNIYLGEDLAISVSIIAKMVKLPEKEVVPMLVSLGSEAMFRGSLRSSDVDTLIKDIFGARLNEEAIAKFRLRYAAKKL